MESERLILAYDIGTTGVKTCLYEIRDTIVLRGSGLARYPVYITDGGRAEQNPDDWWQAMGDTTRDVLQKTQVSPASIQGISFCSQMQGLVLVDDRHQPLRPAMSYMDQRAAAQYKRGIVHGLKIAGFNVGKLFTSLYLTGGVSASVKDPLWKYKWVEEHEPALFARVARWLDVKDYLILRCTDRFCMTEDSANVTFFYDTRPGRHGWSPLLCRMFGVNIDHFPDVIASTDIAGPLTERAAKELGLCAGTPVFGGGGDVSLLGLGSGSINPGDTHIYVGTSGWVSTVVNKRIVDIAHSIASIIGARPGFYNYIAEQETSGKCVEWVQDHLALDEIGVYLEKKQIHEGLEAKYDSLLEYLSEVVAETEPGSGGAIFTPWLHGNRSPFEDSRARGMFFNIGLNTGKRKLIRAVVEGIALHKRWLLECISNKVRVAESLRFVGGGAISDVTCQIMADVTGRTLEAVVHPQNAGAIGAAMLCALGLGYITSYDEVRATVPIRKQFEPDDGLAELYTRHYKVFKDLYRQNKAAFHLLNQ